MHEMVMTEDAEAVVVVVVVEAPKEERPLPECAVVTRGQPRQEWHAFERGAEEKERKQTLEDLQLHVMIF